MNIVINATILDTQPTGLGIYTFHIIKELAAQISTKDKLYVFTGCPEMLSTINNINVIKVTQFVQPKYKKIGGITRFLWFQFIYPIKLFLGKYDMAYNTAHHAPFFSSIPQIITIHDLLPIKFPKRYALQSFYFKHVLGLLIKKCVQIITVSENSKKDISAYYQTNPEKISVVYNALDTTHFKKTCDLQTINKITQEKYFLILGASYTHKNVERAIDAFLAIKNEVQENLLIVGGRTDYINQLRQHVKNLKLENRVLFQTYVEHDMLPVLFSHATAYVFVSLYEGFGIPPLEAMACECPVIASNVSSIPEVCGKAAYYVDPYDVTSIAAGLHQCATSNNVRRQLIEQGLKRSHEFSWKKSASIIYKKIKKDI